MRTLGVLAAILALCGCTSTYSVTVDGEVLGADAQTPRAVRADVHEGPMCLKVREGGRGHTKPLPEAKVTVALKFKGEDKPRSSQTIAVDSRSAQFHFTAEGEASGKLSNVLIHVDAPGYVPVERAFPHPGEVPFNATVLALLDEVSTNLSAPDPVLPPETPKSDKPPAATNK